MSAPLPPGERTAFVAIGRNEGERLGSSLGALLNLTPQVVYVDSDSTDGSAELARNLGVTTIVLDRDELLSAARGRNAGFAEVRKRFPACEFVHFIDGDCIIAEGWLEQAVSFMDSNPRAAVVCGRRFEAHPRASLYNRLIDEEWNTPVGRAEASGGDALVRIGAFEQVGGYLAALKAGEEPEMAARLRTAGWEIWRIDALMTEHDARLTRFGQWWSRCLRGGFGYAQVWALTRHLDRPVFAHQLRSALVWAIAIPVVVLLAAILLREPWLLAVVPLAYAAQVARMAARSGFTSSAWRSAAMHLLAKLPEAIGSLSYFLGRKPERLADYKATA